LFILISPSPFLFQKTAISSSKSFKLFDSNPSDRFVPMSLPMFLMTGS
jgi:hypothetical protein